MWLYLSKLCALLGLDPPHCFFLIASSKAFCSWSPRYPYNMNSYASSSFKRSSIWACKFSLHACAIFNYEFVVNNCASYNKENPYNLENFEFLANMCKLWQKEQLIFARFFLLPSCTPSQNMHLPKLWKTNGFSSCVLFRNQSWNPYVKLAPSQALCYIQTKFKVTTKQDKKPKKKQKTFLLFCCSMCGATLALHSKFFCDSCKVPL